MSAALTLPSLEEMSGFLTAPYQRGAEWLGLQFGADVGNETAINPYDFSTYKVRYGANPVDPRYILFLRTDIENAALTVEIDCQLGAVTQTKTVLIPAGTMAGASFHIPLDTPVDVTLRLIRIRQKPGKLAGAGADNFVIVALLGNMSKLLWVIGTEKDLVRRQLRLIQRQRRRIEAKAASLDLLGSDLRVPRFPAREYSFAPNTIALYHCNETNPAVLVLNDETKRFGLVGHAGVNNGVEIGVEGKFAKGLRFPGPTGNGSITIGDDADFAIAAAGSFTAECFVNAATSPLPGVRIVASKGITNAAGDLTGAGWAIALGAFRGFNNNVRWALSDGVAAHAVEIFSDSDLVDGRFHHIAGIIDGTLGRAKLLIDGLERAHSDIPSLGALSNAEPVRIGRGTAGNQFSGIIDEIRFSSVVRTSFNPVLGEGDSAYRERLGIFERWLLPTTDVLLRTINDAAQISGDPQSFVLTETLRPLEAATNPVRFIPASVLVGTSIDSSGNTLSKEADVCGTAQDEKDFSAAVLVQLSAANVVYAAAQTMQLATRIRLARLVALIPALAGNLFVDRAYDPAGSGLHAVGRALTLRQATMTLDALGVLAHRAGFDFVRNTGSSLEVSVRTGEHLEIDIQPRPPADTPPAGIDIFTGKTMNLVVDPAPLPTAGQYRWSILTCGAGKARFAAHPADNPALKTAVFTRPHVQLVADAAGEIVVMLEYVLNRVVHSGTRSIHIDLQSLPDLTSITLAGELNKSETDALGSPGPLVNTIYLVINATPLVDFGANPDNKRMQIGLDKCFNALAAGVANGLRVVKTFDAGAVDRHGTGLAVLLEHTTLATDQLGAAAHHAGFDFVRRQGTQIYCAVAQGEKLQIIDSVTLAPITGEFTAGAKSTVQVRPSALPATGDFSWSLAPSDIARGQFGIPTQPQVEITPTATGVTALSVLYVEPGTGELPYRFEVRLNPLLEAANATIPKDKFDLVMNILNFFHPIGAEVITEGIRKHVVEVEQDPLKAAPAYTFPDFRI